MRRARNTPPTKLVARRDARSQACVLFVTRNRARPIRCFELSHFFVGQGKREGGDRIVKMLGLRRADDRRSDSLPAHQPRECNLGRRYTPAGGDLFDGRDNGVLLVMVVVPLMGRAIRGRSYGLTLARSRQKTARER